MSRKEPRQLKELRNLMPFAWDTRKEKHPPGVASMRDFQDCLQFSFKQRHSPSRLADIGQRKRRKKVAELRAQAVEALPKTGHLTVTHEAHNSSEAVQIAQSPPRLKDTTMETPGCMRDLQCTPGSGVSDMTPGCRTGVLSGQNPNSMPSHLSTGMALAFSPAVADTVEKSRWQESPPVPIKLLKDSTPEEMDSGSEPMCTSICKSRNVSIDDPILAADGEAARHPTEDPRKDCGKEREAFQSLAETDRATVHPNNGGAQLSEDADPFKQECAEDTASLRAPSAECTFHTKGMSSDLVQLAALPRAAIEMLGAKDASPGEAGNQACISADRFGAQSPKQEQDLLVQTDLLQTSRPSSAGPSSSEKALLEIKALDVQCTSARPLSRPLSALSESRTLPLCIEPVQTCPPLFQKPQGKKGRPASTGIRSRPSSAVSVRQQPHTAHLSPERRSPAGRDAFLFASAVMVLGSHYRIKPKQVPGPLPLIQHDATPLQMPHDRGSLLQGCALLSAHDVAAGWKSF